MDQLQFIFKQSGLTYSRTIGVRVLRGFSEPDDTELNGPPIHACLNGGRSRQVCGARKSIGLFVPPRTSEDDRRFLGAFILASVQTLLWNGPTSVYISDVILPDPRLISQQLNACRLSKGFAMAFEDTHVYRAWDDGIVATENIYFKNNVEINQDATLDVPEVLTTGSGKLALMEDGTAWPAFNATINDHLVLVQASNGAVAVYPESHAVVSGNMQISQFPGSGYITNAAGKLFANIAVYVRAKTI